MAFKTQIAASFIKEFLKEDIAIDIFIFSTMLHKFHCETTLAKDGKEDIDLGLSYKDMPIMICPCIRTTLVN